MAEKKCTGDCIGCSFQQQIYCAAQHGHALMSFMPGIIARLDKLEAAFANNAAEGLINPLGTAEEE